MKIPIVFLGTGQAIPTARRNHVAILLSYSSENILVDCGEGTQRQFRRAGINPCSLTKILITHWHGDHILGLPGLLQTLALNGYNKELKIYVPQGTKNFMEQIFNMFIFQGKLKYKIEEVEGKFLENKDFILEAGRMSHGTSCNAYSFTEKDKLRIDKKKLKKMKIKGKLIGDLARGKDIQFNGKTIRASQLTYKQEGRKITFILDTRVNDNAIKIAKNSDLLICESTYMKEEKDLAERYGHLTAGQAADIAKKSNSKKLVLLHISQRYEYKEKAILQEAKKVFKNTIIAEDLDRVEV